MSKVDWTVEVDFDSVKKDLGIKSTKWEPFGVPVYSHDKIGDLESIQLFGCDLYERAGNCSLVTVLGCTVYRRVENLRSLFGYEYFS